MCQPVKEVISIITGRKAPAPGNSGSPGVPGTGQRAPGPPSPTLPPPGEGGYTGPPSSAQPVFEVNEGAPEQSGYSQLYLLNQRQGIDQSQLGLSQLFGSRWKSYYFWKENYHG